MRLTSSFLRTHRLDDTQAARSEQVLAVGRAFLTVAGLLAIYLDATEPAQFAGLTYGVLFAYAVCSLAILARLLRGVRLRLRHTHWVHTVDILFASLLTFLSDGPGSPLFLFFLFAVAASAYRWGLRATIVTSGIILGIFVLESALAALGPWRTLFHSSGWQLNRTILRIAYLALTAFFLGYLAEQGREARAELEAIADLPRQPRFDLGLRGSVVALAEALMGSFDARAVAIVLREEGRPATLWWCTPEEGADASRHELRTPDEAFWLFDDPGRAWHASSLTDAQVTARTTEVARWPLTRVRMNLPSILTSRLAATSITAVNVGLADEWSGRIYLYDMRADDIERAVHFLEAVGEHVTPVLTNVFLLRRLRQQETVAARARVARELHDGVIQALFAIDMKLEAIRRQASSDAIVQSGLGDVQGTVRREVRALRELMNALKPIELDVNENLSDVLVSVVERFRQDSGVSARFLINGDTPALGPGAALEVVRIVQEALMNVRRHSRARNVLVRLSQQQGRHQLVVEDDGCGFDFTGSLTGAELDARRVGPAIIKERARMLAADLAVHSTPGLGARIELTFSEGRV